MALSISQSATAVGVSAPASFLGDGGVEPYVYSVVPGGAGGTINASTGAYIAPAVASSNPNLLYDTIKVVDAVADEVTTQILVGTPLLLLCEIIQKEMNLPNGRVYLWDQKIEQPKDSDLYIPIAITSCKPFGNSNRPVSNGGSLDADQSVNMLASIDINIISRGPAARDRKEEIVLALMSNYAQRQQNANCFYIGKLPTSFLNLSQVDGAAIPYRFNISVNMQYAVCKVKPTEFYNDFESVEAFTELDEEP